MAKPELVGGARYSFGACVGRSREMCRRELPHSVARGSRRPIAAQPRAQFMWRPSAAKKNIRLAAQAKEKPAILDREVAGRGYWARDDTAHDRTRN